MSEDLTIAAEEEAPEEVVIEYTTREETIAACYNSISAVDGLDGELMGKEYAKMIRRISKRCVKIIDVLVKEMYDETFFDETENEET